MFKGDLRYAISLQSALKFNGGGHINHCIFWTNLSKNGGEPTGDLLEAIKRDFGSLSAMQERLSTASVAIQGSGWGWLGYNKVDKKLQIATCQNQDPLEPTTGIYFEYFSKIMVKVLFLCLGLTFGSMPIICNTGMFVSITLRRYGN